MEKEEIEIHLQGHFGLMADNLAVEYPEEGQKLRIGYDLRGYDQLRPATLDEFWEQLQSLPSAKTTRSERENKELLVSRQDLEDLLRRLPPPIQA